MSKKINSNEIYVSIILNKFLNCFQKKGKKNFIENMFYEILLKMKKKQINGLLVFFYCVEIVKPLMILLPSRKSGIIHYVGSMLSFQEQYFFGLRWLVKSINLQKKKTIEEKTTEEIITNVTSFKSTILKRKKENYALIFKNRALTHFRWR